MRYIRLRAWILFAVLVITVILMLKWSSESGETYISASPIVDTTITNTYPGLYEALYRRDAGDIRPYLSHESDTVRNQAWRALATTPVDSLAPFIELAAQQGTDTGWFALSTHEMSGQQLRALEQRWEEQPEQRAGIARVLGRQGDRQSLNILLSSLEEDITENEHYALALSRLIMRHEITEDIQIKILQKAFGANRDNVRQAYLYGWYRGPENALTSPAKDTLLSRWREQGLGISRVLDQYGSKILPERTYTVTNFYNGERDLEHRVQLAIELAKSLDKLDMNSDNALAARILLVHPNAHVKKQTLQSIAGKMKKGGNLHSYITGSMIPDTLSSGGVWLEALRAAGSVDSSIVREHADRIERVVESNPYLMPRKLALYRSMQSADEYLQEVRKIVDRGDTLFVMYAMKSLTDFWEDLPEQEKTGERIRQLREITFDALDLRDRGVAYLTGPLLEQEDLFRSDDFERINRALEDFSLPGDIEVYQQFGALYKERFEQQAQPVIDSLADLQYAPLNRFLDDTGWQVEVETPEKEGGTYLRTPDWERLWELGAHPEWTLYTEKGNIVIRMDPLKAPATVSAIDSLSRTGAYENVPFHRVVPDFVIQGGDIERRDGFGGPGFMLPTETAESGFVRGTAGIASAGRDTEGSQYFMMHQWSPHLNGRYTRFGKVVEGMDVVDRIEVGDKVLSTSWY
ncbi:Peptidyl-prolyl cis-trans isomerase (rotamase)-cyclophilin family [Fodinibius roseus]|uniref:peptidylprolyl isomerase n=1 Tax=Fodinibius roseus TaxID=1194090 RepID=A0A1M5DBD4_9BACT|nr:peptidylprolyl isomerase [Fodinibius roseus]SHF64164.1 Peptidyl-prolyl cis-trans isomerase (rotamase)-cyclophilin family [Fodinibius roseus]